ncbi:alanine racemase [Actinokineospora sp. UTMC 2448]|uniref:alanine racemase n=1 Tax=Actinokineospora sp. UTMC 2448 TaxID=2268449 RepID=UPI002164EB25|nr:alanine racemase [Actinokineospora sp. UTMC 2448]UVS79497.1 L-glutamyl-[BtrI acyl-carrier protein] decarboxylase [Actinokineospora sp. UTMC 2448]
MSEDFDPARWPTPLYAYDLAAARDAADRLRSYLPSPSSLYYSLKANPHPDLVRALHQRGCSAEVSSTGELSAARAAGVSGAEILYTGPGKTSGEIDAALVEGVRLFSVDSPASLDLLDARARTQGTRARYLIRVNPSEAVSSAGLRMTGTTSQFGADSSAVASSPERFVGYQNLDLHGLHLYLATNLLDEAELVAQFRLAVRTAALLRAKLGVPFHMIDLGGGFGAPYAKSGTLPSFPGLAARLTGLLDESFPRWRDQSPMVAFESGRYLASTSGRLFTRVLDAKTSHGRRVVVIDSGIHHLGGMSGLRRVPPIQVDLAPSGGVVRGSRSQAMVCGPLCTPLDTWSRQAQLAPVTPGDLLVVPNVGAYGLSASLALFLGHPMPAEVAVDGPSVVSASQLTVRRAPIGTPSGG